jgi:hypothetical protein
MVFSKWVSDYRNNSEEGRFEYFSLARRGNVSKPSGLRYAKVSIGDVGLSH